MRLLPGPSLGIEQLVVSGTSATTLISQVVSAGTSAMVHCMRSPEGLVRVQSSPPQPGVAAAVSARFRSRASARSFWIWTL